MTTRASRPSRGRRLLRGLRLLSKAALALGAVALTVFAAGHAEATIERVRQHPYFRIARIEIRGGGDLVDESELRERMGVAEGGSLWAAAPSTIEARLESHPMVAVAAVRRVFPDTLEVRVRERKPAAITVLDDIYYLDRDGETFGPLGPQHDRDYPVFTGVAGESEAAVAVIPETDEPTAVGSAAGGFAAVATAAAIETATDLEVVEATDSIGGQRRWAMRRALQLLRRLDHRPGAIEVSELHLDARDGLILHPVKPQVPLYLGWRGWERRLRRAERILESWQGATDRLARIDLRFRGQVVVKLREPLPRLGDKKVSA